MLSHVDRRRLLTAFAAVSVLVPALAFAQGGHSPPQGGEQTPEKDESADKAGDFAKLPPAEKWQRRFPQPVLVSDLIGRKVLDRKQGVLGYLEAVVTTPGGDLHLAFGRRRFLAWRGDTVVVPNVMAALLGPFVMLPEATDDDIAKLPTYRPDAFRPVDAASRIRMALTKH